MFSNAVTSAVGRLYAGAVSEAPRIQVQRVEPVARTAAVGAGAPTDRSQAEEKSQRQALADGVRSVFESAGVNDAAPASTKTEEAARLAAEDESEAVVASDEPDNPILEEAILRFIHSVFRGIAETEGLDEPSGVIALRGPAGAGAQRSGHSRGLSASREQLGRRIGSFAERLARAGAETDPLTMVGGDAELGKTFTTVVKALGGGIETRAAARPTRGDLVALMHRLAHAMQGSPPLDDGLPTVGGLLRTKA